jgi:hypothetical protein
LLRLGGLVQSTDHLPTSSRFTKMSATDWASARAPTQAAAPAAKAPMARIFALFAVLGFIS